MENFNSDFGDKELQLLLNHFKTPLLAAGISIEEAQIEWTPLKKKWFLKGNTFFWYELAILSLIHLKNNMHFNHFAVI